MIQAMVSTNTSTIRKTHTTLRCRDLEPVHKAMVSTIYKFVNYSTKKKTFSRAEFLRCKKVDKNTLLFFKKSKIID